MSNAPALPADIGGLTEATLHELHAHWRAARQTHYDGTAGFSQADRARAWLAIMRTYPELLAAARLGLERRA